MHRVMKKLHLYSAWRSICVFLINHIFVGLDAFSINVKRTIMNSMGFPVGKGTTIVSPLGTIMGTLEMVRCKIS